jgi:hypothetical protein
MDQGHLPVQLDLRSVRAFRFVRLFRAFKMVRYSKAIQRFHRAFLIAKEEIVLFLCVAGLVLYFAAVGIYYFENEAQPEKFASVFHSLWWAVATLTTVGYGDLVPVSPEGRGLAVLLMLVGIALLSVVTANIAAFFVEESDDAQLVAVTAELTALKEELQRLLASFVSAMAGVTVPLYMRELAPEDAAATLEGTNTLVDAIIRGDVDAAEAAMVAQLDLAQHHTATHPPDPLGPLPRPRWGGWRSGGFFSKK